MKKSLLVLFATCLFISTGIQAGAQTGGKTPPPKILSIFREDVKASRGSAHEKLEAGYVRALQKANWPTHSLGMVSTSGAGDAWFMTGYDSLEAMETDRRNMDKNAALMSEFNRLDEADAEFRTSQRSMVAAFRPDMSFNPEVDLPQMHYFEVITVRVRPGHDQEFAEGTKLLRAAYEKANMPNHYAIYQVVTGTLSGTYLIFIPMKSLKEFDTAMDPKNQMAMMSAMGEENSKKFQKIVSDAVINTENSIYAFSPEMSYVPKEWEAANPNFWATKGMVAMKPAAKKNTSKTTAKKQP